VRLLLEAAVSVSDMFVLLGHMFVLGSTAHDDRLPWSLWSC
jgi:hypothetical protein